MQVYKVDPTDLREACVAICKNGTTTSCKGIKGAACEGQRPELVWQVQFLVKDAASQLNKNFYRVMLFSGVDGLGKEFFGKNHPPANLYEDEDSLMWL